MNSRDKQCDYRIDDTCNEPEANSRDAVLKNIDPQMIDTMYIRYYSLILMSFFVVI